MLNSGEISNAGIADSLVSTLRNALEAVERGDITAAVNMLESFIKKLEAQAGKHITEEAAATLIEAATQIPVDM